jgi:hypothetical protein
MIAEEQRASFPGEKILGFVEAETPDGGDRSQWSPLVGSKDALRRYERWRRFDSLVSAAAFDGLNRLFSNDWTLLRTVRDAGLGLVDRLPAVKRMFVGEAAGLSGELPRLVKGQPI